MSFPTIGQFLYSPSSLYQSKSHSPIIGSDGTPPPPLHPFVLNPYENTFRTLSLQISELKQQVTKLDQVNKERCEPQASTPPTSKQSPNSLNHNSPSSLPINDQKSSDNPLSSSQNNEQSSSLLYSDESLNFVVNDEKSNSLNSGQKSSPLSNHTINENYFKH